MKTIEIKDFAILLLLVICCSSQRMTNNFAALAGQINVQLPNLFYPIGQDLIKLNNGVSSPNPTTGSIYSARLTDRILNADFNNDGLPDAAVILNIVYTGIGYFTNTVFIVLQDLKNGPYVTNGINLGIATYKTDIFTLDYTNNNIIASFVDRLPGQPKAALPTVPTYYTLKL
jgi:hypothetical protein